MQSTIERQYTNGLSQQNIEHALAAAGLDASRLKATDLAPLEDFHTMGRIATGQLADIAGIVGGDHVLDAGSGIGGTARFLADEHQCTVATIDLTEEYCETARWLNRLVGVEDKITVHRGDVTDLPFADATFNVVVSQHVQMNVADKAGLYGEARRVLVSEGRLAVWDVIAGVGGDLAYPLPWADHPDRSYLVSGEELRASIEVAGFDVVHWKDMTEEAVALMQVLLSLPPAPLGIHAFVDRFAEKATNLTEGLDRGRLRVVQVVSHALP
jgi:SAM-dependent methyltransferase